jgi:SAM-dependent methyltransferase
MFMREEKIQRLDGVDINTKHPHYLVYYFFHRELLAALTKYSRGRLLDIGCGNKPYKTVVESRVTEYVGCDIVQSDKECVDVVCKATDIPLEDCQFDTVISTQVIEHLERPDLMIKEAYRLLAPGGNFIVSGPLYWPLHEEPHDYYRFTKYGFSFLLEDKGFVIQETRSNGGKWALAGQALVHALYPDIQNYKSMKGKVLKLLVKLVGGIKGLNRIFLSLDERYPDPNNTMNYVIVARKVN